MSGPPNLSETRDVLECPPYRKRNQNSIRRVRSGGVSSRGKQLFFRGLGFPNCVQGLSLPLLLGVSIVLSKARAREQTNAIYHHVSNPSSPFFPITTLHCAEDFGRLAETSRPLQSLKEEESSDLEAAKGL